MAHLWKLGYAAEDIIGNIFRVTKSMQMSEELKLDFIKVDATALSLAANRNACGNKVLQNRVDDLLTLTGDQIHSHCNAVFSFIKGGITFPQLP
jgi:hypothetical protein